MLSVEFRMCGCGKDIPHGRFYFTSGGRTVPFVSKKEARKIVNEDKEVTTSQKEELLAQIEATSLPEDYAFSLGPFIGFRQFDC